MKTVNEKIEVIENLIDKVERLMFRISGQRAILHTYLPLSNTPPDVEIQVRYDPSTLWSDFCFLEGAIIYHIENYAILVRKLLEQMKFMCDQMPNDVLYTSIDTRTANGISYEFDSFVIKFLQTMDEETIDDLEVVANRSNAFNRFDVIKERSSKNIADGLFWQLNLLRNPAAHYMKPNFQERNGIPIRFKSRSSIAEMLHINEDNILLPCLTLVDLKKSPQFMLTIKEEIDKKIKKGENLKFSPWNLIMPKPNSSVNGEMTPFAILPSGFFEPFDLLGSFCDLISEAGEYLENINHLFYGCMGEYARDMSGKLIYGRDAKGNE